MKKLILFAPIAEREIEFFLTFANEAKQLNLNYEIQFISFFQPGNKKISAAGFKVWDLYEYTEKKHLYKYPPESLENEFAIENLQARTLHEKVTFNHKNTKTILNKFHQYLNAIDLILTESTKNYSPEQVFVFQELGGFVAPLSLYYNCLKKQISHIFFEPSFFRSHMHFIKNSLNFQLPNVLNITDSQLTTANLEKTKEYFEKIRDQKHLVIVKKDLHHYRDMGIFKILNLSNIKKLASKLLYKYYYNYRQEYEWVGNHIIRTLKQYFNRLRLGRYYQKELPQDKFIYFPFHVQLDYQLTIRNPEFLNQLALVKHLCEVCPQDYKVVVKEHPITIGGFNYNQMKELIEFNSNLVILHPMINTHEIVQKAEAIVTINSKVGAESLVYNKRVVCLGHGFYWNSKIVDKIDGFQDLQSWLLKLRHNEIPTPLPENIRRYFAYVLGESYPFELYNHEPSNLKRFHKAVIDFIEANH